MRLCQGGFPILIEEDGVILRRMGPKLIQLRRKWMGSFSHLTLFHPFSYYLLGFFSANPVASETSNMWRSGPALHWDDSTAIHPWNLKMDLTWGDSFLETHGRLTVPCQLFKGWYCCISLFCFPQLFLKANPEFHEKTEVGSSRCGALWDLRSICRHFLVLNKGKWFQNDLYKWKEAILEGTHVHTFSTEPWLWDEGNIYEKKMWRYDLTTYDLTAIDSFGLSWKACVELCRKYVQYHLLQQ